MARLRLVTCLALLLSLYTAVLVICLRPAPMDRKSALAEFWKLNDQKRHLRREPVKDPDYVNQLNRLDAQMVKLAKFLWEE